MAKLSNEDLKRLADIVKTNGRILLDCDGFKISLSNTLMKRKLITVVYVNNQILGLWGNGKYPESKFWRPIKRSKKSKDGSMFSTEYLMPFFTTEIKALKHINTISNEIQIVEEKSFASLIGQTY